MPTEFECQAAVAPDFEGHLGNGNFVESRALHPMPVAKAATGYDNTSSAPRCVAVLAPPPRAHLRATYRNFFSQHHALAI